VPPDGDVLHPGVEPHVSGRLAGYLELYPAEANLSGVTVVLEIAEGEASPALAAGALNIGDGSEPSWRIATGAVEAAMAPGRYLARATVRRDGAVVRVVSRPFVLERGERPVAATSAAARAAALSPELQRRTAAYVSSVIAGFSNVVAQEELVLVSPDRRVTSDFLLVRYPGSERDLMTYRDAHHVNGEMLPDRAERLIDLFVKPLSEIRQRAREIALAAEKHVPPALNPLFVLAFLQADYQPRFQLSVGSAGNEWPPEVKALTFVEVARPTLLRGGPLGDQDMPTRGTAWVEEVTGRILQTELQVGTGRSATGMVTRFAVDDRLQIMVPQTMRTQNPAGVATYSNFRRFTVETKTDIDSGR
jgi:hypothetical protein